MSLIAHWKLDDNAASTTVVATVGTNATLQGGDNTSAKTTAGPGGSITSAFDLNDIDDYVDLSASAISFLTSTALSISIWFQNDVTSADVIIGGTGGNLCLYKPSDTTIDFYVLGGGNTTFTVPSLGTGWHHILATRTTGNGGRIFIDGTESSSGTKTVAGTVGVDKIGRFGSSYFNGKVAWLKVFDSDESANVATLYAEGVSGGSSILPFTTRQTLNLFGYR